MIKGNKSNRTTKNDVKKFIDDYLSGKTIFKISRETGFNADTIKKWLIKNKIKIKIDKYNKPKSGFTNKEKKKIIHLYVNEKRGAKYIGNLFKRSDRNVAYWLNKWGVKKNTRSEISFKIREIHGPTKGFSGKKHSKKSKKEISKSGKESWAKKGRIPISSKSRTYNTAIGNVLGTYEVAYLQKLIDDKQTLPKIVNKRFKTPYGSYTPDFEFDDKFIEIKSDFTLKIAKGLLEYEIKSSKNQWKKIKWLSKNVKLVEIIVLKQKEVKDLFRKAINSNFVKI